jgi:membrane dipeptidase
MNFRGRSATLIFLILLSPSLLQAQPRTEAEAAAVAERVLARDIIIDTHADTPQLLLDESYDLADPNSPYMISIPKMRQGHLGAEFFSIWVDVNWPPQDLIHRAVDLIDAVDEQITRHGSALALARTADDITRLRGQRKVAILMGLEGGHILEDDPRVLDVFYRLGIRYMTLTHTKDNLLGDSSTDKPRWGGLSEFGREVVARMNRLGMMVDVSHVSDKTFYDALGVSQAPVIASHSSCRALCDAPRDMSDDMIRALAKNGGVMDINFYSAFLDPSFHKAQSAISKSIDAAVEARRSKRAREGKRLTYLEETRIRQKMQADLPRPSFQAIADHIDHAGRIGGIDHVGVGSDLDGVDSVPRGMEDVSKLPNLVRELARRGYSDADLEKLLGGNVLRVMRQVEQAALHPQAENGGPQ